MKCGLQKLLLIYRISWKSLLQRKISFPLHFHTLFTSHTRQRWFSRSEIGKDDYVQGCKLIKRREADYLKTLPLLFCLTHALIPSFVHLDVIVQEWFDETLFNSLSSGSISNLPLVSLILYCAVFCI